MDSNQMLGIIEAYLREKLDLSVWLIDAKEDSLSVRHQLESSIGFNLSLPALTAKLKPGREREGLIDAATRLIEMAKASVKEKDLRANLEGIYPVLRSSSHPTQKQGVRYLYSEHTAESRVYYAFDLGTTYVLIDETMIQASGLSEQEIKKIAIDNLKKLDTNYKEDQVAGNKFYFFNQQDGYAASRILNDELLTFMQRKVEKEIGIAIPHQDVLIIADLHNETGYKVLSRLTMDFCMKGDIPITPLPFLLTDSGELEAMMIISNPGGTPTIRKK